MKQHLKRSLLAIRGAIKSPLVTPSSPPPELRRCQRIMVFRTDRLGDAVLTFPFVRHLRALAPEGEIFFAVSEPWAELFRGQGQAIRVIGLPGRFSEQARLLAEAGPDLIFDPQTDTGMRTARLALKSGARWRIGFSGYGRERFFTSYSKPLEGNCHFWEEAFTLLALWGSEAQQSIATPFLDIPNEAQSWWRHRQCHRQLAGDYLCLHPGAFFSTQRWPLDRFVELSLRIRKELAQNVVWCWGKEKTPGPQRLEETLMKQAGVTVLSGLTLERLAAIIGDARLFVGNNSGPLHLACALGIPTVSMLGPTFPQRWWPVGDRHSVLWLGVACSPCRLGRCSHHTCLKGIDVERVFQAVRKATCVGGGTDYRES